MLGKEPITGSIVSVKENVAHGVGTASNSWVAKERAWLNVPP